MDYQKGKIYKIISLQTKDMYIGSTCQKTLAERMTQHRSGFKLWKAGKRTKTMSYDLLDKYNDCEILLIENYPCDNKDELRARERYWIEKTEYCINKKLPGRTNQEYMMSYSRDYQIKNKEQLKEYNKKYIEQNNDKIKEQRKKYREENREKFNCECGSNISKLNKTTHEKTLKHINFIKSQ